MSTLTPHGACLLWKPELIWLNAVSDAMLAVAFFTTAFVLGIFLWRRRDLTFRGVFAIFAVFTAVCGIARLLSAPELRNTGFVGPSGTSGGASRDRPRA